jgi:hypothetical protein
MHVRCDKMHVRCGKMHVRCGKMHVHYGKMHVRRRKRGGTFQVPCPRRTSMQASRMKSAATTGGFS